MNILEHLASSGVVTPKTGLQGFHDRSDKPLTTVWDYILTILSANPLDVLDEAPMYFSYWICYDPSVRGVFMFLLFLFFLQLGYDVLKALCGLQRVPLGQAAVMLCVCWCLGQQGTCFSLTVILFCIICKIKIWCLHSYIPFLLFV